MRYLFRWISLMLLSFGFLLIVSSYSRAQDGDEAEYMGTRECTSCHREQGRDMEAYCEDADACHMNALLDASDKPELIVADFSQGDDVRTVQFPGEDEPRPFTAEDIQFAIGSKGAVQRYVVQDADDQYWVLPVEWSITTEQWQPYVLDTEWPAAGYDFGKNCVGCHVTGLNTDTMKWEEDGVACEACHGPGSIHLELADELGRDPSEEELAAVRSAIVRSPDAQTCGQCHSRGMHEDYHYPVAYHPGGDLSAAFELVAPDDSDHWWSEGFARKGNMQYNEWLNSAHASALTTLQGVEGASAECLVCHSSDYTSVQAMMVAHEEGLREGEPPAELTLEVAQHGVTCTSCHNVHTETAARPAMLVTESYALCTTCHTDSDASDGLHHPVQQLFEGQSIVEGIEGVASSHYSNPSGPKCATCHMPTVPVDGGEFDRMSHTMQLVLPSSTELESQCATCHEEQATGEAMQAFIEDTQAGTLARLEAARAALQGDEPAWITTALDFVEGDGSLGIHNFAYTDALLDAIEAELMKEEPNE